MVPSKCDWEELNSPSEATLRLFCINHVHPEPHLKPGDEKAMREGDVSVVYFSNVFFLFLSFTFDFFSYIVF